MSQTNILHLYEVLMKPGPPRPKNKIIESLQYEDALALLKRVFHSVIADPSSFSQDQKFLALSLDYQTNLLYADIGTGFKESIETCIDLTTLYKPDMKKFIVLLFKLPEEINVLSENDAKKSVANINSSGISPQDLFNNSERFELVHVNDYSNN
ncbi:hypothetical protein AWU65_03115 [Paenibacillus glucanolyticus]|uniref:Uncharacterized protein n=2 Tax=Paenibacillus TaxID=44249 RepID=A0A163GI69_9BACL|nr:hypothetical protein AWU65_03115 [Paenibacillus glucanolyticus]OMF64802.1 hypothetical protein BK142_31395 [Paenibacillus glucanolyticus]